MICRDWVNFKGIAEFKSKYIPEFEFEIKNFGEKGIGFGIKKFTKKGIGIKNISRPKHQFGVTWI